MHEAKTRAGVKAGSTGKKEKKRYFTELRYERKATGVSESSSYDLLLHFIIFVYARERTFHARELIKIPIMHCRPNKTTPLSRNRPFQVLGFSTSCWHFIEHSEHFSQARALFKHFSGIFPEN